MEFKEYLVVMGVPSIKKYVFGTDRLVEIRGASGLLEHLYKENVPKIMKHAFGNDRMERISIGGGAAQFRIKTNNKVEIEECMNRLEKAFLDASGAGIDLIWGIAGISDIRFCDAHIEAINNSEIKRNESPIHTRANIHTGFIRECESCSKMASHTRDNRKEERLLCSVCFKKDEFALKRKTWLWDEFLDYLEKKGDNVKRPSDFEEIGELCKARPGYTAVVYADGNAMGKLIRNIETIDQYKFFSNMVDQAIRMACHEALYELFFQNRDKKPKILPADILLLGGDDLVVYITAEKAMPFAINVANKFNQITKDEIRAYKKRTRDDFFEQKLKERGLTISLGIAYGKSHSPFSILLDQASELLQNAKKNGDKDPESNKHFSPTYIDYHISPNFKQICVKDSRKNHLMLPGRKPIQLFQKPYSIKDAERLLSGARDLIKAGVPKTRLKKFGNAPLLGKTNGTLECLKLYVRSRQGEQRESIRNILTAFDCITNMPWKESEEKISTVLVDLIEIAQFCESKE